MMPRYHLGMQTRPPGPIADSAVTVLLLCGVLVIPLMIAGFVFGPCRWLTWMPIQDVPARCIPAALVPR